VITNSYGNVVSSFFGAKFGRHIEELLVAPLPNWLMDASGGFFDPGQQTVAILAEHLRERLSGRLPRVQRAIHHTHPAFPKVLENVGSAIRSAESLIVVRTRGIRCSMNPFESVP
jgi:hypothetical protein